MLFACLLPGISVAAGNAIELLIDEAIARHPLMKSQQAMSQAAAAGVEGARWQYYPTPTVSIEKAQVNQNDPSYTGDKQVAVVGLRQPLWTGGRLDAGLAKAQANALKGEASLAEARQQLSIRVIQGYGEWLTAAEKQKVYESGLLLHRQMKELVQRRVKEGQSAPSDLTLAEERLAAMEAESIAALTQAHTGLSRLSLLVGRTVTPDDLFRNPAQVRQLSQPLAELLRQAEAGSPLLARYRALAQIQQAIIDERKADSWPEVHARLERQSGNYSVAGRSAETRVFVGVTTRLGAGLSTQSSIAEAISQYESAVAEIDVQQHSLNEQIMVDHTLLVQSEPRRNALREANEMSKRVLQSWDRQFLSGRKSWQDLMNSAREQVQMEVQIADLDASRLVASWRISILTEPFSALSRAP
jgi:adhesin transport system outer membrane protein